MEKNLCNHISKNGRCKEKATRIVVFKITDTFNVRTKFCKKHYEFPRGVSVVQKSGVVKYFCSSKCRKNSEMGRDNRKVKWVKKAKKR